MTTSALRVGSDAMTPASPVKDFCSAMRRLAGACTVIASSNGTARGGLTATAVCSLTADPPRLVVCVNRSTLAHSVIVSSRKLSVNVLGAGQEALARRFAGMVESATGEQRFENANWLNGATGVPVVRDALASFEGEVTEQIDATTHSVFVCDVKAISMKGDEVEQDDALVYLKGQFCRVTSAAKPN